MTSSLPDLPPHTHDEGLAHQILEQIGAAISEHRCDLRPDHLYVPEHELFIRARAGLDDGHLLSYVWAEHERWGKPAVVFMLGRGDDEKASVEQIGKDWARGVQPALCALFHDPRRPRLTLTSHPKGRPGEKVPWRGATGGVHGWVAKGAISTPMDEGHFLHAVMGDVCSLLHLRELMSVLAVLTAANGSADATVYLNGHIWERASESLRNVALPEDRKDGFLCQKLYVLLEPCEWNEVDREWFMKDGPDGSRPPAEKSWWKRLFER
jgi:hypothetical protein